MVNSPFAFGSTLNPTQQSPWGPQQAQIQSAQQVLQWLQLLPQQLQQLTYLQQQTLQQLLQVIPAQYQQLQQVVQLVPHVIHQLQHHVLGQLSPAGLPYGGIGVGGFGNFTTAQPFNFATAQPFQAFPSVYAAQPSHVM
jgi:hypothetical protein